MKHLHGKKFYFDFQSKLSTSHKQFDRIHLQIFLNNNKYVWNVSWKTADPPYLVVNSKSFFLEASPKISFNSLVLKKVLRFLRWPLEVESRCWIWLYWEQLTTAILKYRCQPKSHEGFGYLKMWNLKFDQLSSNPFPASTWFFTDFLLTSTDLYWVLKYRCQPKSQEDIGALENLK